jgi:hypothetical protein
VVFAEGWFRDTIVLVDALAVLRFDGDTDGSTIGARSTSTTASRREAG